MYFLIHSDPKDEACSVLKMLKNKDEVTRVLNKGGYGEKDFLKPPTFDGVIEDIYAWYDNAMIIQGEIIVPVPKKIITEYVV